MRLRPGAHELILLSEGKNIVPDNVLPSVMLMEACALAAIDHIVLENNPTAALVGVKAPAAIGECVHVVNQIVAHDRSWLRSQRVNRAHIAQAKLADIMQMIELDDVRAAGRFTIAPRPAD